jgi:hypothetical protein
MQGSKKHRNWDSRIPAKDTGFTHVVRLPWANQNSTWWNTACIDVLEVFGLPGDRFTSRPTIGYMDFYFKSERDKQLCQILLSEKL